jgi:hypothetical protein
MSDRILCENCNKKYTPRNIENHKIKCCSYSKCDFCNKVLSSPYNLQVHLQKCKIKINLSYENLLKYNPCFFFGCIFKSPHTKFVWTLKISIFKWFL